VRNEGSSVSSNAPDSCQQLSHRRYNGDLARFTRRSQTLVVLAEPRIASHCVENHHPERLTQARVSEAIPLGNARLRHALWIPVLVAIRFNPWLRAYYQRLRAVGRRPKVAIIACMHKLLAAVYSVAKNRRPFVPRLSADL